MTTELMESNLPARFEPSELLPDRTTARRQLQAVREFQATVQELFVRGHDFGVIPGLGARPTLLKPGAEKLAKLLGLSDQYEILDRTEDWDRPLFRYLVRCRLVHIGSENEIAQGLGECNSMEAKYRWRWVWSRDITKTEQDHLRTLPGRVRTLHTTRGDSEQFRLENDDIYSQVNTILKMAKKRALVDAALSAGRLSDVFTQDLEDMSGHQMQEAPVPTPKGATGSATRGRSRTGSTAEQPRPKETSGGTSGGRPGNANEPSSDDQTAVAEQPAPPKSRAASRPSDKPDSAPGQPASPVILARFGELFQEAKGLEDEGLIDPSRLSALVTPTTASTDVFVVRGRWLKALIAEAREKAAAALRGEPDEMAANPPWERDDHPPSELTNQPLLQAMAIPPVEAEPEPDDAIEPVDVEGVVTTIRLDAEHLSDQPMGDRAQQRLLTILDEASLPVTTFQAVFGVVIGSGTIGQAQALAAALKLPERVEDLRQWAEMMSREHAEA